MTKDFEKDYQTELAINERYDRASTEDEKEAVRKEYRAFGDEVDGKGKDYAWVYKFYTEMKRRGNEYIDIDDITCEGEAHRLVEALRKFGFEYFTFTSTWSSAVEIAWEFTQAGCTAEGMVEINSHHKDFYTDEFEKRHGFLFKVN